MGMMNSRGVSPAFFLACMVMASVCYADKGDARIDITQARQNELKRLVRNDCGACHGMKLSGGLGPSLLPDALKTRDSQTLVATILYGRAGTPMPPWRDFLNEDEAAWIAQRLLQGFPDAH